MLKFCIFVAISSVANNEDLNKGPYVNISLVDSRLVIATNDAFDNYEEYETASLMGFTISFRCTDGSSRNLVGNFTQIYKVYFNPILLVTTSISKFIILFTLSMAEIYKFLNILTLFFKIRRTKFRGRH